MKTIQNVEISQSLQNHSGDEKYAWMWLLDNNIIGLSLEWFDYAISYVKYVERQESSIDMCGNSPRAMLHVFRICKCMIVSPEAKKPYDVHNRCTMRWYPQFKETLPELFKKWSMMERYSEIVVVKKKNGNVLQYVCDRG